jgi:hypothetical protein
MTKAKTYTLVLTEAEMDTLYNAIRNYYDFVDNEEELDKLEELEQKVYKASKND